MNTLSVSIHKRKGKREKITHKPLMAIPSSAGIFLYNNPKKQNREDFTHFYSFSEYKVVIKA